VLLSSNCGKTPSIGPSIALLVETKELGQILPSKAEYSEKKVSEPLEKKAGESNQQSSGTT